jgi:peptidoglycan/LPS O-acetylase OafA/YrhL
MPPVVEQGVVSPQPATVRGLNPDWEIANLDLLRAMAVLLVLVSHLLDFFGITRPGGIFYQLGHWGVLMFFVHTSLVLMLSLERQREQHYRKRYGVFLLRRVFRLFPLSILVVAFVSALHLEVSNLANGHFVASSFDARTVLSNVFLVQNLTHTDSVMGTLWTLPNEIQMYLVLPALFLVANNVRGLILLLVLWLLCAVVGNAYLLNHPYLDLPKYVPCFISGVIGYKLLKRPRGNLPFIGWPLLLLLTTAIYQVKWGVKIGWVLCLAIGILVSRFREMPRGRLSAVCQIIARYSYGIYLTHFVCIWFAFVRLDSLPPYLQGLVFVLTAVTAPVVLYHAVEAPMIGLGGRLIRRWAKNTSLTFDPSHELSERVPGVIR